MSRANCKYRMIWVSPSEYCPLLSSAVRASSEYLYFRSLDRLFDKRIKIVGILRRYHVCQHRACLGMLGRKHGTAVLIGLYGYIKCVYLSGYADYLRLVHADNRTEYRHIRRMATHTHNYIILIHLRCTCQHQNGFFAKFFQYYHLTVYFLINITNRKG